MNEPSLTDRIRKNMGEQENCDHAESGAQEGTPEKKGSPQQNRPSHRSTPRTFTADSLMRMEIPPQRWAVEGIVPEGLSILAGKPKLGKSWLVLHYALEISAGGTVLGRIVVEGGDVLYISLEDTKRRLQSRIGKLLGPGKQPSSRLHLAHEWPRLDRGGGDAIAAWIKAHPDARLIIIDTWAKFRPTRRGKADGYDIDYADGAQVKSIADKLGVSIVIVHHCRKLAADDAVEEVSGSVGLTGACDGVLVMRRERGQHDATLMVTGRDVDEKSLALSFAKDRCLWQLMGDAEDYRLSKERAQVLAQFDSDEVELSPKQVADRTGMSYAAVRKLMPKMAEDGQLVTTERGHYRRPSQSEPKEEPPNSDIDANA